MGEADRSADASAHPHNRGLPSRYPLCDPCLVRTLGSLEHWLQALLARMLQPTRKHTPLVPAVDLSHSMSKRSVNRNPQCQASIIYLNEIRFGGILTTDYV